MAVNTFTTDIQINGGASGSSGISLTSTGGVTGSGAIQSRAGSFTSTGNITIAANSGAGTITMSGCFARA